MAILFLKCIASTAERGVGFGMDFLADVRTELDLKISLPLVSWKSISDIGETKWMQTLNVNYHLNQK